MQFFGPTNFSPVIKHVTRFADAHTNGSHYFVLLILTDGEISDMHDTKKVTFLEVKYLPSLINLLICVGNYRSLQLAFVYNYCWHWKRRFLLDESIRQRQRYAVM